MVLPPFAIQSNFGFDKLAASDLAYDVTCECQLNLSLAEEHPPEPPLPEGRFPQIWIRGPCLR